jgi:acetyl-CoA synthetase
MWYRKSSAATRCPIVDTWWQTETGGDHDLARCPA